MVQRPPEFLPRGQYVNIGLAVPAWSPDDRVRILVGETEYISVWEQFMRDVCEDNEATADGWRSEVV